MTGTTDWASYEIRFLLKKGESSDLIKLNVAIEGKGTLWIKDVELLKAPPSRNHAERSRKSGNASELTQQGWAHWQKGEMPRPSTKFEQAVKLAPKSEAALERARLGKFQLGQDGRSKKSLRAARGRQSASSGRRSMGWANSLGAKEI